MHTKTLSYLIFRSLGVVALVLSLSIGILQPAIAEGTPNLPVSIASDQVSTLVDPLFEPLRLVAPNCTYGGLIKSVVATDQYSVTFNLCRSDAAFISKIAMPSFAIYPQEWIEATAGDTNRTSEGLEHPIGTGPYKVSSWDRGNNLTFVKNPDYWGAPPQTDMLVFRWSAEPADRLLALQAGTIDGFDAPSPDDYATIKADPDLQLAYRHDLNTFYIGMTNTFTPFDDIRVRQAIAMGIDRQHIVDTYYPAGSEVATHFTPCSIPNGCAGTDWYIFNPVAAKALLTEAGYPSGFPTHLYYRNVQRVYLPEVANIAQEIHDQLLANLGIDAVVVEMESGPFIQEAQAGQLNGFHLLGWAVDYPHISNFLDYHFGQNHVQFGTPFPAIYDELNAASTLADPLTAAPYYTDANNAILDLVPMVPVAHGSTAVAYLADVNNPQASPFGISDIFAGSDPGGRNIFRWMQAYEPFSLFCADEADGAALRACTQITEPLYNYVPNDAATEPALAESCIPNVDATVYVCTIRQGVKFHDGTSLDANDVVETFAMGLDVSSPYHKGNSNIWEYYNGLFGLMDTAVYTISGNAGVGNVTLKYVDGGNRTVITGTNGNYSFKVSYGWTGTVTPFKTGFTFTPIYRSYANVQSNQTAQNYIAKPISKPGIPVLFSPASGKLLDTLMPTLDWKDSVPAANHYQIQVSTNNTFTALVTDETDILTSNFTLVSDLDPGKQYFWRVQAFNLMDGTKGWSTIWNFKTPLTKPVLDSPLCSSALLTDRPDFNWQDVNGATKYLLHVSASSSFGTLLVNATINESEYSQLKDLPQNKTLYWRVKAMTSVVSSPWSEQCSFTTGNPPSVPLLVAPASNALVKDYTPKLDWSNSTLPVGTTFKRYELQVDDNNDFSTPEIEISTTDGLITESYFTPLTDLTPNTKYFWRVRAVNLVGADEHVSGWSAVRSFRTVMLPPTLLLPLDLSTETSLKPLFDWENVDGATSYTIQISTSSGFGTFLVNLKRTVSDFTPTTNLPKNKTIYWRVRANGPNGPSAWSTFQFTTPP